MGGAAAALRIDGPHLHRTSLATLQVEIVPALDGRVELYVPLVDWRVVTDPFSAPLAVVIQTHAVDRSTAQRAIQPRGAARELARLRGESRTVLRDALRRAAYVAVGGGVVGGTLTGALVAVAMLRRRAVLWGAVVGAATLVAVVGWSGSAIGSLDERDLRGARLEGQAAELPHLLAFSQQLLHVGEDYERLYSRALRGLDNLRDFARRSSEAGGRSVLLASDVHNNEFVLDAFDQFAGERTVLLAGDYGQVGARVERRLAPQLARLGGRVIAVGGNHDSATFMNELERHGATVLGHRSHDAATSPGEGNSTTMLGGLRVAGYEDPLLRRGNEPHILRVYGDRYQRQVVRFLAWYDGLQPAPDVVLLHQRGLAERLLARLAHDPSREPVILLTGHSHQPAVRRRADHVLVDAGTLGAGGPFAIGEQDASFAQLQFRGRRLVAVDIVRVDPISGSSSTDRTMLD